MLLVCIVACLQLVSALPVLGKKTNYDEITARKLLNMAAGAYGDLEQSCIDKTFPTQDDYQVIAVMDELCDKDNNTCRGYISASDVTKELLISFRGTTTTGQLLLQALQSLLPLANFFDMGLVNQYFLNGHNVLWQPVEAVLTDPKYTDYKATFTGHSLGGALASLAAARTAKQGLRQGNQITLYTFGEPRVGNVKFARAFDAMILDSYRVVFRRDMVPHLPPCAKKFGDSKASRPCNPNNMKKPYHHALEIWYHESMESGSSYLVCTGKPYGEDFECSDKLKFYANETESYIWDHRHYFDVNVGDYGEKGCSVSHP